MKWAGGQCKVYRGEGHVEELLPQPPVPPLLPLHDHQHPHGEQVEQHQETWPGGQWGQGQDRGATVQGQEFVQGQGRARAGVEARAGAATRQGQGQG